VRRSILAAASGIFLAGAIAVGPFGASAAAPYVYGCTPAAIAGPNVFFTEVLNVYNGSSTTANLTHKILAGDGTILNAATGINMLPVTSTLAATRTDGFSWGTKQGYPTSGDSTIAATVRVVSNVPLAVTLAHDLAGTEDWRIIPCLPIQP
jgi:hypothetical protein